MFNDQLKGKMHAEEVQNERGNKKIGAHTALAHKIYAIRMLNKQPTKSWTEAQSNENNGNVVQSSRRSSITNNEATSTYQIP